MCLTLYQWRKTVGGVGKKILWKTKVTKFAQNSKQKLRQKMTKKFVLFSDEEYKIFFSQSFRWPTTLILLLKRPSKHSLRRTKVTRTLPLDQKGSRTHWKNLVDKIMSKISCKSRRKKTPKKRNKIPFIFNWRKFNQQCTTLPKNSRL